MLVIFYILLFEVAIGAFILLGQEIIRYIPNSKYTKWWKNHIVGEE